MSEFDLLTEEGQSKGGPTGENRQSRYLKDGEEVRGGTGFSLDGRDRHF